MSGARGTQVLHINVEGRVDSKTLEDCVLSARDEEPNPVILLIVLSQRTGQGGVESLATETSDL